MDIRLQDRRDVRREEHTTFAHSTERNARHRGAEAVETRTSTELPEKKKRETFLPDVSRPGVIYSERKVWLHRGYQL